MNKKIIEKILDLYNNAETELNYETPFQLVVAIILSAQCTDERVNIVTKPLFKIYKTAEDFDELPIEKLEKYIFSTGFYKNKAKNIKATAKILKNKKIPKSLDELVALPGIGRKTANVVLAELYNIAEGIVVDTHVLRVSNRLGLTSTNKNPIISERELLKIVPKDKRVAFSHAFIQHGRKLCKARKPLCNMCPLALECKFKLSIS